MQRLILLLVASAAVAAPTVVRAQEPSAAQAPVVVASGEALVMRAPDQAFISVAVETRARSPRDAQRQNADAMVVVQQRLAMAGVPKDAVRTLAYNIQQEFDFTDGRRTPRGFVARNMLDVRLDDIDRVGEILDTVVQAGATSVAGVRFDLKDRGGAEREALRLAVADARSRAEAAAAGAGSAIVRVIRIEDSRQNVPSPRMYVGAALEARDVQATTPIEAGPIEIRASVMATFAIK